MAKKDNHIDNESTPKIINDWLDIFEDKVTSFYMDEDVRYVFVCDLIRHAALDEEEQFDKILKLHLFFESSFSFEKNYEIESHSLGSDEVSHCLKETTDYYPNLVNLATIHFSDKYAEKMIQRIANDSSNSQIFTQQNIPVMLANVTARNLKNTLSLMLSSGLVNEKNLIKTWFADEYHRCIDKAYLLLTNEKFIGKILSSDIGLDQNAYSFNTNQKNNIVRTLSEIINRNIKKLNIQQAQSIVSILYKVKDQSYPYNKGNIQTIKNIIVELMGYNLIEPDTLFNKVSRNFNPDGVEITKLFELDNHNLEKVYEKRKQLLNEKLAPAKKVTIKRKI